MKSNKNNRVVLVIVCVLAVAVFLAGAGMFLYPIAVEKISQNAMSNTIKSFTELVEAAEEEAAERPFAELYTAMSEYNELLYTTSQEKLSDPFSFEQPGFDMTEYGFEENVIGYITIPKIDIEIPLYLGATNANMRLGATILGNTSMPIGGVNTNCVIAAHRGTVRYGPMFRNLDLLELNDVISITTLWETRYYEVTEIKVILPGEVEEIIIRPGEELVSLLTCHPYTKNTNRLLVICSALTQ